MKIKKQFKQNPLVFLATLMFIFTFSITPILANSGAGEGGGSQSNERTMWREINGESGTTKAWDQFMRQRGIYNYPGGDEKVESIIRQAGNDAGSYDLVSLCKSSEYIWYYSFPGRLDWAPVGDGTNNVPWQGTLVDNPRRWGRFENTNFGSVVWNRGRTVIICSGAFDNSYKGSGSSKKTEPYKNMSISGPKTKTTMQARMTPERIEGQPSTWNSRQTLSSDLVTTSLGTWVTKNPFPKANASTKTWETYMENLQAQVNSNNASSQKLKINGIEKLTEQFKEGGAWTVVENSQQIKANLSLNIDKNVSIKWNATGCNPVSDRGRYNSLKKTIEGNGSYAQKDKAYQELRGMINKACTGPGSSVSAPKNWTVGGESGKPYFGKTPSIRTVNDAPEYYQLLSVRCNKTGFGQVANQGGKVLTGDSDVLGMIQSPRYSSPSAKYYGIGGKASQTGKYDFYTKTENCDGLVKCVPNANPEFKGSEQNNINKPVAPVDKNTGKDVADWNNGDTMTFFRDGKKHDVRTNLWYPVATSIGNKANVTISKDPHIHISVNETYLNSDMFMVNELLLKEYNNKTPEAAAVPNHFYFSGQWATDNNKPIETNFAWEYDVKSKVKIPNVIDNNNVGMGETEMKFIAACDLGKPGTKESKPWFDVTGQGKLKDVIKFSTDRQRAIVEFVRSINADK